MDIKAWEADVEDESEEGSSLLCKTRLASD
jgi:hypothetical protein